MKSKLGHAPTTDSNPPDLLEVSQRLDQWRIEQPPRSRLPASIWSAAAWPAPQITPGARVEIILQMRVLVAVEAVDGGKGIDSLAALCRQRLEADPFSGWMFNFRTRSAQAINILCYDCLGL